jgi:hypothetical protein
MEGCAAHVSNYQIVSVLSAFPPLLCDGGFCDGVMIEASHTGLAFDRAVGEIIRQPELLVPPIEPVGQYPVACNIVRVLVTAAWVRFELTEPLRVRRFSRPLHSTTLPPRLELKAPKTPLVAQARAPGSSCGIPGPKNPISVVAKASPEF